MSSDSLGRSGAMMRSVPIRSTSPSPEPGIAIACERPNLKLVDEDVVMGESSIETVTPRPGVTVAPSGVLEPAASLNRATAAPTVLDTRKGWDEEEADEDEIDVPSSATSMGLFNSVNPSSPPAVAVPCEPVPLRPSPTSAEVKHEDVGLLRKLEEPARIPGSPFRCPSHPCFTSGCPQKTPAQPTEKCQRSRSTTSGGGTPLRGDFRVAGPHPEALDRTAEPDDSSELSMDFSTEIAEGTTMNLHFTYGDCEVSRTKGRSDAPTLPVFDWRINLVARGGGPGSVSISAGCIWKTGVRL